MADFLQLDDNLFVSSQLSVHDVQKAIDNGIKMIVCNRPNGEKADQIPSEQMAEVLKNFDIDFRYIPVVSGEIKRDNVIATKKVFDEAEGPILAYCGSGLRSTVMWAMVQAALDRMSNLQIVTKASEIGFDLNPLMGALTGVREDDLSQG